MAKTEFAVLRDGVACLLIQATSKSGFPKCVNCGRTVPPRERRFAKEVFKRPAYFCTGACAMGWARAVAKACYKPAEWTEPAEDSRPKTEPAKYLKSGDKIRRKGKEYMVVKNDYAISNQRKLTLRPLLMAAGEEDSADFEEVMVDTARVAFLGRFAPEEA